MTSNLIAEKERNGSVLRIRFQGMEMDPSFVNTLRRIIMGELPCYSLMGNFTIHSNTSIYNDEYLETRFKLVPIYVADVKKSEILDQRLVFHICEDNNPKAPLVNENDLDLVVTTHMLQIYDEYGNKLEYDVKDYILYDFPMLKLRKGEEFHLSVEINDGIGRNHSSWKSAIVTYKFENDVSLRRPEKNAKRNPISNEVIETIKDKKEYKKNVHSNPESISMTIKGNGHYEPETCFMLALNNLEEKLHNFRLLVENPMASQAEERTTKVEILPNNDIENYIQIKVTDPDKSNFPLATHTMGNLLANHLYYHLYDKIQGDIQKIRESMCSYNYPHPLDTIIYVNIKTPEGLYGNTERYPSLELLDETITNLLGYIAKLRKEFQKK